MSFQNCHKSSSEKQIVTTQTSTFDDEIKFVSPAPKVASSTSSSVLEPVFGPDRDGLFCKSGARGSLLKPIVLCLSTSFGGFIFGWDVGTIGGISNMESFKNNFGTLFNARTGTHYFPDMLIGLVISIFNIGCAVGGLTLAKVGDWKGRKIGIYASLLVYVVGLLIQVVNSTRWYQFFVGRIFSGLAVGSTAVLVPMFISESAPLQIRGAMVVLYQLMITLGILMGNVVNYACKKTIADALANKNWQIPVALGFVWSLVIAVGIFFMPESAQFLVVKKNDVDGALRSVAIMNSLSAKDPFVAEQVEHLALYDIDRSPDTQSNTNWLEFLVGRPRLGLRLLTGMLVMAFQQLSGANYFFYYGTTLFDSVGVDDSYVTSILLSSVNFASTFGGIYLVEKLGRKSCLLLGSAGMFVCMTVYASIGSFALRVGGDNVVPGAVMIAFTCVYIMFFACTTGPVSFVVISELFPARTKAISMAICTSINWFANFLISLFTPYITSEIGFRYGYVFAGCLLLSVVFVWCMVPETKGLTIEQVDELYTACESKESSCGTRSV